MNWALVQKGVVTELRKGRALVIGDETDQITFGSDTLDLAEEGRAGWSEAELNKLGVYKIVDDEIPANKVTTGTTLEFDQEAGVVRRRYTVEDVPLGRRKSKMVEQVNAFRDSRLNGGFEYAGTHYQTTDKDQLRITATSLAATLYIAQNQNLDSLRWADANVDFTWIAANNDLVSMTAPQVSAFGLAAMAFVRGTVYYARSMKNSILAAESHATLDEIVINEGWP